MIPVRSLALTLLMDFLALEVSAGLTGPQSCITAQSACKTTQTCGMQLHNAMIKCGNIYSQPGSDDQSDCSDECEISLLELERSTKEGRSYARCSCLNSNGSSPTEYQHCQAENRALFRCRREHDPDDLSLAVPEPRSMPTQLGGCNDARRYCEDNTVCRDALHYYERVCEANPQVECPTLHCLESYDILMRRREAQFVRSCRCDAVTPEPRVIYCFSEEFFKSCSLHEILERQRRLLENGFVSAAAAALTLNDSFTTFMMLFSSTLSALFFLHSLQQ
ncbi:hypothetical protein BV898_15388 [Hypsibius exemplaris]|uniref:GDNF/GAS1 domain-containing protein n=1 Tax=Hypsibius exemplaris TaxID=2072580 RepID=A0A9X6RKD4_HYPEX|nr:hypothetical protein BV898_15388 [Hypsibius exemplaris]